MNREIKFRAWDTKNKKFIEGVPPKEYMLDSDEWDHHDCEDDPCFYPHYVFKSRSLNDRVVFQQYTECKDKNGKEIYEGDILKHTNLGMSRNGLVKFYAGAFFVEWSDQTDDMLGYLLTNGIEIVGNIFETIVAYMPYIPFQVTPLPNEK